MARALTLTMKAVLDGTYTNAGDNSTPEETIARTITASLTSGTSDDQADRLYHTRSTLAASATDSIDLQGALEDSFGQAFTPARIRGLLVFNRETTAGINLQVGGNVNAVPFFGAAAEAGPRLTAPPRSPGPPAGDGPPAGSGAWPRASSPPAPRAATSVRPRGPGRRRPCR